VESESSSLIDRLMCNENPKYRKLINNRVGILEGKKVYSPQLILRKSNRPKLLQ
jgi:hypothetical protein